METKSNVSIVTDATSMIDNDVVVFIVVFGQGLYFTKENEQGPNQSKSVQIIWCPMCWWIY